MSIQLISGDEMGMNNSPAIDEETHQKFEKIAIRRLIQKLDWRLIPFLCLLEMGSYINRTNIGHAKLMGIDSDLDLSPSESDWAVSLFFLAFVIFEIPSMVLMRYLGPAHYLLLSMLAWGGIAAGMAFVRNAQGLLAARFFLGVAQAGFFPSIIIYFSLWYRKRDQTMRITIIFGAAIISGALDGILAYSFTHMDGIRGLNGWQWMFLLEGLPMISLGIITCLFLSNIPDTVQWLNICEKHLLTNILRNDTIIVNRDDARLSWRQVLYVFIDWRIYLYALIGIGNSGVIKYIAAYLPSRVEELNISGAEVHLMTAPPYVFAFVFCLLVGYSSSRRNEHGFHLMFCLSVALLGFILMITLIDRGKVALYVSSCISCCGVFAALPVLLSWLTINVDGHTKRAVAVGFTQGVGQLGGIILPFVDDQESSSRRSNFICLGILTISLAVTIILRICLVVENRRRDHLSPEKYHREAAIKEPCDWHPDVRYAL